MRLGSAATSTIAAADPRTAMCSSAQSAVYSETSSAAAPRIVEPRCAPWRHPAAAPSRPPAAHAGTAPEEEEEVTGGASAAAARTRSGAGADPARPACGRPRPPPSAAFELSHRRGGGVAEGFGRNGDASPLKLLASDELRDARRGRERGGGEEASVPGMATGETSEVAEEEASAGRPLGGDGDGSRAARAAEGRPHTHSAVSHRRLSRRRLWRRRLWQRRSRRRSR